MAYKWWERAVFYQVYPRSFADNDGDGIGDIPGIIEKLDYLKWLGVGAIWLSPHYPSAQVDGGYDIADYTEVEPAYGTMTDFDRMIEEIHNRDMKLLLDLVLNHTSDRHPWFQESRSSLDNPKRDWYIWRDGDKDGGPPNNWQSEFGGSAWEYEEQTRQWYYHYFLKEQPDLNWRNPEVKEAMFKSARFWLDKGADGFRLDAIGTIYEDKDFTPHTSRYTAVDALRSNWLHDEDKQGIHYSDVLLDLFKYQRRQPENFELIHEFRMLIDEYDERFLVGETLDLRFLGSGANRLHSIFNFNILYLQELSAGAIRALLEAYLGATPKGTWLCNTLNNHDQSRVATHFAQGDHADEKCRTAIAVTLFLEGIPFLYYGEEIGMRDYALRSLGEMRDRVGDVYRDLRLQDGVSEHQILKELGKFSRDRCRTPMQWGPSANAGFSPEGVKTWLPVHDNHRTGINVFDQIDDPDSLLHFYRTVIRLRNDNVALQSGAFVDLDPSNDRLLVFLRETAEQTCLIAINFSPAAATFASEHRGRILHGGKEGHELTVGSCEIEPFGVLIAEVEASPVKQPGLEKFTRICYSESST
jgi:alpha-glucosidase